MNSRIVTTVCCLALTTTAAALAPPLITVQPNRLRVYQLGDAVTLSCSASGTPAPTFSWSFNDQDVGAASNSSMPRSSSRMYVNPGTGSLVINESRSHDQGYYKCRASNSLGTAVSDTIHLVRAMLENFAQTSGDDHATEAVLGASLSLQCGSRLPASYPKPDMYWMKWSEAKQIFLPIDYSARTSMDPNGTLHFASVAEEDQGAQFNCVIDNPALQQQVTGPDYKIVLKQVVGQPPLAHGDASEASAAPLLLFPGSPSSNTVVMEGQELRMKCIFGGNPTPSVNWTRAGGFATPAKAIIDSFGQEFVIKSVSPSDAGVYECEGRIQGGPPTAAKITVVVHSAPRIIAKPPATVKGENESVTFTCQGKGTPRPTTAWLINGKPITGLRERMTVNAYNLSFTNLRLQDTVAIQCNVSHDDTGWDATSFYLHVKNEPPRITRPLPTSMKLAEGLGAYLSCPATGHPSPVIRWQKDGQDIVAISNGTLAIMKPKVSDSGVYACIVTNGVGQAQSSMELFVRSPTIITAAPLPQTIAAGEEALLTCEATTDFEEIKNLVVSWQKDHVGLDFTETKHLNKVMLGTSLSIRKAEVHDSGIYTCIANNLIDMAQASAKFLVQGPPEPPTDVEILECKERNAQLHWLQGANNNAEILDYRVEYNTTFDSQWRSIGAETSDTTINVELLPWVNYTFRVTARNVIGHSIPSLPSTSQCKTPGAVPSNNPVGVRTVDEDPTVLVIAWQPTPMMERHGPGFFYEISYVKQDPFTMSFSCPSDSVCHQYYAEQDAVIGATLPVAEHKLRVLNQTAYTAYNISVRARNSLGHSSAEPISVIGFSGEGVPEVEVSDFRVDPGTEVTARSVTFSWTHVDTDPVRIRGLFKGYKIRFWRVGDEHQKKSVSILLHGPTTSATQSRRAASSRARRHAAAYRKRSINGSSVTKTIDSLPPYSELYFDITVLNQRYSGKESAPLLVKTPPAAPGSVSSLQAIDVGPNHVLLQWNIPEEPNGEISSYGISYQTINGTQGDQQAQDRPQVLNLGAGTRRAKLTQLRPLQTYRVVAWARTVAGSGEEKSIEVTTISQGHPGAPRVLATSHAGCSSCVNVSWFPDTTKVAASTFYVEHRLEGDQGWLKTMAEETIDWLVLKNLTNGVYEVRVVASNGEDYRTPSETTKVNLKVALPAEDAEKEPQTVFASALFIGLLCGVILLIILVVLIVFVYRQRQTGRYPVHGSHETEKLKPDEDDGCLSRAYAGSSGQSGRGNAELDLEGLPKACENGSDDDSAAEFQEEDAGKFNEDGSFIDAYREDKLDDSYPQSSHGILPPSSANASASSTRSSPQLSTFQQHLPKGTMQQQTTAHSNDGPTAASRSGSITALQPAPGFGVSKSSSRD